MTCGTCVTQRYHLSAERERRERRAELAGNPRSPLRVPHRGTVGAHGTPTSTRHVAVAQQGASHSAHRIVSPSVASHRGRAALHRLRARCRSNMSRAHCRPTRAGLHHGRVCYQKRGSVTAIRLVGRIRVRGSLFIPSWRRGFLVGFSDLRGPARCWRAVKNTSRQFPRSTEAIRYWPPMCRWVIDREGLRESAAAQRPTPAPPVSGRHSQSLCHDYPHRDLPGAEFISGNVTHLNMISADPPLGKRGRGTGKRGG